MSVAALLSGAAVCVCLTVGALAVRAGVAFGLRRAIVCRTSCLAVVAANSIGEVTDRTNGNSVS